MHTYTVDVFHNVTTVADAAARGEKGAIEDLPHRADSPVIFTRFGSEPRTLPGDRLRRIDTFTIEAADKVGAAETAFAIGNDAGPYADCERYRAHRVRSLSVGDVVVAHGPDGDEALACSRFGWDDVNLADFKIVEG